MNIVYVPCKDKVEAKKIARKLTANKLAVCINIIDHIESVYRWKGKVEESVEAIIIIKTLPHLVKKLISTIKKLHSYEMPEIVSWRVDEVDPEILKWASRELKR